MRRSLEAASRTATASPQRAINDPCCGYEMDIDASDRTDRQALSALARQLQPRLVVPLGLLEQRGLDLRDDLLDLRRSDQGQRAPRPRR